MKIITSLFILFSSITLFSQEKDTALWDIEIYGDDTIYTAKPSKGDIARKEGDLVKAITEFRKIYQADSTNKIITYNMACAFALQRRSDSAFYFLTKSIKKDTAVFALNDPDFYFLMQDPRWDELVNNLVAKVEAKHGKYENLELSKELWDMKIKDQAFYYHLDVAEKKGGWDNPTISAIWELKHIINQKNVARLEEIISQFGWPKQSVIGGNAASTVFLVIQHADIEIQKKYLPLMKEAANAGEAEWSSLALLIDRVNLREGKKQIYGSQIYRDNDGEYYVKDLENPKYVNQRRAEVGLSTIQEYVSMWDIEWTIKQKTK